LALETLEARLALSVSFASTKDHDKLADLYGDFTTKNAPVSRSEIVATTAARRGATSTTTSTTTPTTPAPGPPPDDLLPDVFPWEDEAFGFMHGGYLDTTTQPGRTLYRFATAVPNIGAGPMELRGGAVLPDGDQEVVQRIYQSDGGFRDVLAGEFTHHPEHGHIHFDDYASYSLREVLPANGVGDVVATGAKISFCLLDITAFDLDLPNADQDGAYSGCNQVQGISVGWADVYEANLADQWVDVTGLPPGQYWLENVIDPTNQLLESDETNNTTRILIDLATTPGTGDRFEFNDTFLTATNLGYVGDRTEAALTLHDSVDDDFFRLRAAADGTLNIDVEFQHALGDVDIVLFDADENEIARSEGTADLEHVATSVTHNSVYYLQVLGHDSATSPNYRIVIDGPNAGDITQTISSTDVPHPIPDFPPGGPFTFLESTLEGPDLVVTDLNVILDDLPHTWLGDLHIELVSPAGTTAVLIAAEAETVPGILAGIRDPMDNTGPNDFLGTILDDQAATSLAAGVAPYTGSFNIAHPSVGLNPLSQFNGENALGTWTLRVADLVDEDIGSLESWSIQFTGTTTPPAGDRFEPNDGFGTATDLGSLGNRTETDLSIHLPNNEDIYRFTPAATGNLVANVLFSHAQGNIDAGLYDASQRLITFARSLDDDEQITWGVTAGVTYFLRIVVFNADVNPEYDLVINGPDPQAGKTSLTVASDDVPKVIPDNAPAGVTSTLVGPNLILNDVNLMLDDLRHTWLGDLHIELTSPAGTTAVLTWGEIEGPPGIFLGSNGPDNLIGTIFDDEAALNLRQGDAPFSGHFNIEYSTVAENPLSVFEGENAAGVWTLRLADTFTDDVGVLNNWSLEFRGLPPSVEDAQISGTVFHDRDGNGQRDENEPGVPGWTVFLDSDDDGVRDAGPQSRSFGTDTPRAIAGNSTITSTVNVSGLAGTLSDVNVSLAIAHLWVDDLDVFLVSPAGTRVELFTDVGLDGDDFYYTSIDDHALTPIALAGAPFAGPFAPETPLEVLNGEDPTGTWTLEVTDDDIEPDGTLVGWWLTLSTDNVKEPVAITDADGNYSFSGLPDGDYTVTEEVEPRWTQTFPALGTYAVTLAGDTHTGLDFGNQRQTIHLGGLKYRDQNGNQTRDANESPLSGWTIYLDQDDNGQFDPASPTVQPPVDSVDVPKNIVDIGTTTSTLDVAGLRPGLLDLDVTVNLTHTFDSDLTIELISPTGTRVELTSNNGGDGDHYTNTTFDDEATTSIVAGAAPFTGSFRPEMPLSAFDGEDPNGAWTLELRDNAFEDTGVLLSWSLTATTLSAGDTSAVTDAEGRYLFEHLPPGQYNVREAEQSDWQQTTPIEGKHDVTLTEGHESLDLDFGNQSQLGTLGGRVYDDAGGDGDGTGDPSLAGWVVYRDLNGNALRDVVASTTDDFASTDVPAAINDFATQTSELMAAGLPTPIADVNVSLAGTHTYISDIDVFLISPAGTRVELFSDVGGSGDNFNTSLDDEAAAPIVFAVAPFTGTFRPEGLLSALVGEDGNGVWTLEIRDVVPGDVGSLTSWSLTITTAETSEPFVVTGSDGRYEFDFLPPGAHTVREEVQAGFSQTEPATGSYTLTLAPAAQTLDLDFGNNSQCLRSSDLDNDLDTDRDDLVILMARFGQSATPAQGDIDCSGVIALADLHALQADLTPPPPPSAPASAITRTTATLRTGAADRVHSDAPIRAARRLDATHASATISRTAQSQPEPTNESTGPATVDENPSRALRARRQRTAREWAIGELFAE
jgi:subtilisin-like proprotein convertase family protein